MQKNWKIKPVKLKLQKSLSQSLNISYILAQILINRGVTTAEQAKSFLGCELSSLHSPFLLKGIKSAVARIKKAISQDEKIMVWGDYDIDGITSVCLLSSVLKKMGADVSYYLPNRLEEGYGLNEQGAQQAKDQGVKVLITVDCGVTAHKEIDLLNDMGIDVIVTDHHQPRGDNLPSAFAIINPLQKDCKYPYKYLAGVGIAAKLASALVGSQDEILNQHLDLIALGTVGDIVSLTGENRILVKHGLVSLEESKKLGLRALINVVKLSNRTINAGHVGFILGPRINASGRLGSPEDSLKLFLAETELEAYSLAQKLNKSNRKRQKIEADTLREAIEEVESQINFKEHNIIVLARANWHQGVIGIVASRLVDKYLRPAIVLSTEDGFSRGSGRSIGNFHLLDAVKECKDLLEEYGGHRKACGIRLKQENFDHFFKKINTVVKERLLPEDLASTVEIDVDVALSDLDMSLVEQLDALSPFGADNSQPVLCSSKLKIKTRPTVVANKHIKFWVTDGKLTCEAIGFNQAKAFSELSVGDTITLAYVPSINTWQGNHSIQLKIEDLQAS